jgi:2-dehydropantoate 2-reductase
MSARPRIVVLGAGSIGCHVGLTWLAGGLDVRFIGRPEMAVAMERNGARVENGERADLLAPRQIDFSTGPAALAEADIIALCVKITDDAAAAAEIAANARPGTVVLSLQNGVDNSVRLGPMLPGMTIVEGMVPYNVIRPQPAHFRKASTGGLMAGRNARLETALAPLSGTPGAVEFRDDMRAVKWSKLLLNLNNPLNALSGMSLHEELSLHPWRRLLAAMQSECLEVMDAENIEPAKLGPLPPRFLPAFVSMPDWLFNRTGLKLQKITRDARSSMADDFAAGRKTEIDFLNGTVAESGRRHGVPCPANDVVTELVRQAGCGGRKTWTAAEIVERINQRMAGVAS